MLRIATLLVLAATLTACGQLGFELVDAGVDAGLLPDGALPDAALPDGALPDVALPDVVLPDVDVPDGALPDVVLSDAEPLDPDAGDASVSRCDDWTDGSFTFDIVGRVTTGDITGERGEMRLSRDGSMMYFGFANDVYQAPRVSELVFAPATPVAGLDTPEDTYGANLTADGLSALVMVDGGGHVDIWRYDRTTQADAFTPTRAVDELNTSGDDWDPLLTPDGLGLYFGRYLDDVGSVIYARRASVDSAFATQQTFFNEPLGVYGNPSVNDDETILVMNTRSTGSSHLHYSTRAERGGSFTELTLLPGVQERTETEPYLTPDGCEVYYTAQSDTDGYRMLLARYRRL